MSAVLESICCREFSQINNYRGENKCVTLHPHFEIQILSTAALEAYTVLVDQMSQREFNRELNR